MQAASIDIPNSILGWFSLIGMAVVLVLLIFNRSRNENIKHQTQLITTLSQRVDTLDAMLKDTQAKLEKVLSENDVLSRLILRQGPEDKKLQEATVEAFRKIDDIYEETVAKNNQEAMARAREKK